MAERHSHKSEPTFHKYRKHNNMKTIQLFNFSELSEEAKVKAIQAIINEREDDDDTIEQAQSDWCGAIQELVSAFNTKRIDWKMVGTDFSLWGLPKDFGFSTVRKAATYFPCLKMNYMGNYEVNTNAHADYNDELGKDILNEALKALEKWPNSPFHSKDESPTAFIEQEISRMISNKLFEEYVYQTSEERCREIAEEEYDETFLEDGSILRLPL